MKNMKASITDWYPLEGGEGLLYEEGRDALWKIWNIW